MTIQYRIIFSMKKIINKILLSLNFGNHQFDSHIWKSYPDKRKVFVEDIVRQKIPIRKNRKQILLIFGNDPRIYSDGTWSYPVEYDISGKTEKLLHLYFDDDIVYNVKIRLKTRN